MSGAKGRGRAALAIAATAIAAALALPGLAAASPVLLTVAKEGAGQGTVTSSPAGIECGATCAASFEANTTVILTGVPTAPGTRAPQWTGCESVNAEDRCTVKMSAAREVTAAFRLGTPLEVIKAGAGVGTVTSSPAGIECGATCQAGFLQGTTVVLTGTRGLHSLAVQWSGCEHVTAGKCEVTMSAARSVTASFELEAQWTEFPVTIEKTGTGQGTVTGSPGSISCGAVCSGKFLVGTALTLTATPAEGSVFAHWSGGGCSGAGPCTTTVQGEKTVKAVFTAVGMRALTVSKAGTGQGTVTAKAVGISCGTSCSVQVPAAQKVTLSAKAASGSTFAHWSGACSGAGICKVAMNEAREVTATFTARPPSPPPSCVVPKLAGKSLSGARTALGAAHCALGKVRRPKARGARKLGPLLVRSSSPAPGTILSAGAKIDLRLRAAKNRRAKRPGS